VIALVDYGAGNLTSVRKAFAAAGAECAAVTDPHEIGDPAAIVIPGVGHFGATRSLDARWRSAIEGAAARGTPLLGICLGLQWLFEGSDEAPALPGLGYFAGTCTRLTGDVKVPHVGWNRIAHTRPGRLLAGIEDGAYMYFTHAYAAPITPAAAATTTHGVEFAAAVERDLVFGVQFHPEKSGDAGLRLVRNFVALAR
jgi:imidazole glycerol-phosphate synthase subunit HisH